MLQYSGHSDLDKAIAARMERAILQALEHVVPATEADYGERAMDQDHDILGAGRLSWALPGVLLHLPIMTVGSGKLARNGDRGATCRNAELSPTPCGPCQRHCGCGGECRSQGDPCSDRLQREAESTGQCPTPRNKCDA